MGVPESLANTWYVTTKNICFWPTQFSYARSSGVSELQRPVQWGFWATRTGRICCARTTRCYHEPGGPKGILDVVVTLALMLVVATVAVVLWRASASRRDRRKTISKKRDGPHQKDRLQSVPTAPPVSIDTPPANAVKPQHSGVQPAEYKTEHGPTTSKRQALEGNHFGPEIARL